jgi:hypothetical protein
MTHRHPNLVHLGVVTTMSASLVDIQFDGHLPAIYSIVRFERAGLC